MHYPNRHRAIAAAGLLAMAACDSEQLPVDSTLSVSPTGRTYEITENENEAGRCVINPEFHIDMPFVVQLRGPQGSPVGGARLQAYLDLGANTFSGYPVLALYEDRNGNGVVDADTELVSAQTDDLASLRLDEVSGTYTLLVRANLSCAYRGELFVYGQGVSATASIEITGGVDSTRAAEEGLR